MILRKERCIFKMERAHLHNNQVIKFSIAESGMTRHHAPPNVMQGLCTVTYSVFLPKVFNWNLIMRKLLDKFWMKSFDKVINLGFSKSQYHGKEM